MLFCTQVFYCVSKYHVVRDDERLAVNVRKGNKWNAYVYENFKLMEQKCSTTLSKKKKNYLFQGKMWNTSV